MAISKATLRMNLVKAKAVAEVAYEAARQAQGGNVSDDVATVQMNAARQAYDAVLLAESQIKEWDADRRDAAVVDALELAEELEAL